MVEIADIKDRKNLEAWLHGRPQEDAVFIAARAALRVAPLWWGRSRSYKLIPLPFLRCCLISSVATKMPTDDIKAAANTYDFAARAAYDAAAAYAYNAFAANTYDFAAHAAYDAAAAAYAYDAAAYACNVAAYAASAARRVANIDLWDLIRVDVEALIRYGPHHWPPLWEGDTPFAKDWTDIQKDYGGDPWEFWIYWYWRMLAGDPFPEGYLDLLYKIATMPDKDWRGEQDEVNGRIAALYEKFRLLQEVRELKSALAEAHWRQESPPPMGHNNSPEVIDSPESITSSVENVLPIVEEAEEELKKPTSDKSRLRKIGEGLLQWTKSVVAYCGKVGNAAVMAAAGTVGAGGGAYLLDQWLNNGRALQLAYDVIKYATGM